MNKNNLTKAELISQINKLENEQLESKKLETKKILPKIKKEDITFSDIILKIRNLILSLSIVAFLMQIFKNYKSIRAILKLANYIILSVFGISMFDAFGLGFITKLFGEFKFIFGAILAYLMDTSFYKYLITSFKAVEAVEAPESTRSTYKKPIPNDWKEEYEKIQRQIEMDKWKARYERYESHKQDYDKYDMRIIALLLLLLSGSIAAWYNPDLLQVFSPVWNIGNLIKSILRGGRPDDNDEDGPSTPHVVELDPDVRSVSPDMLVYSSAQAEDTPKASSSKLSDKVDETPKASSSRLPPLPPKPPSDIPQVAPEPGKMHGPGGILEQLKLKKTLKPVTTVEKRSDVKLGKVVDSDKSSIATSSTEESSKESFIPPVPNVIDDGSLTSKLKNQMNKMRHILGADEDDVEPIHSDDWDENNENTQTIIKQDKGKDKEIINSPSTSKSKKFLESISLDETKIAGSSGISPALKPIMDRFPNLSKDTLLLLSTPEGMKNRHKIIASLPDSELTEDITPFRKIVNKLVNKELLNVDDYTTLSELAVEKTPDSLLEDLSLIETFKQENKITVETLLDISISNSVDKILDKNPYIGKQEIVEKLLSENPRSRNEILNFMGDEFMKKLDNLENIFKENKKTLKIFNKQLAKEDIKDMEIIKDNPTVERVKILKSLNRSHNNLMAEIKKQRTIDEQNSTDKLDNTMDLFS